MMRALYRSMALVAMTTSAACAQSATETRLPAGTRVCDMSVRVVSIRLVDAAGAPVSGASIVVRRVRTRATLEHAEAMGGQGDYKIIEDGELSDLRREGEPFDVSFTKGGRVRKVRLVIGQDAGGCHVLLKRGPASVRF